MLTTEDKDLEQTMTKKGNILIHNLMEAMDIPASSLEALNERNIIKLDKKAKLNQFASRSATIIAREKNDPLYKKMAFHRRKFLEFRDLIRKKYGAKAIQRARLAVRTGTLVDPAVNRKNNGKLEPKGNNKI
jgi:hypothetical protein